MINIKKPTVLGDKTTTPTYSEDTFYHFFYIIQVSDSNYQLRASDNHYCFSASDDLTKVLKTLTRLITTYKTVARLKRKMNSLEDHGVVSEIMQKYCSQQCGDSVILTTTKDRTIKEALDFNKENSPLRKIQRSIPKVSSLPAEKIKATKEKEVSSAKVNIKFGRFKKTALN